jgi:hypothetical protein
VSAERAVLWFAVIAVLCGGALAACSGSPGNLRADRRVKIVEPKPGSTVASPVTVRWTSEFEAGGASGLWFVVYLDAAQVPPGTSALVAAVEPCATVQECLDGGLIDGPFAYLTTANGIALGELLPGPHRVMIVLVDADGIRQGAVGWNASFRVEG